MRRERGFTLIELLVVIIILGILLAVAIPRYFEGIEQAKRKAYCSTIANLRMALEVYRTTNAENGYTYPEAPSSTVTLKDWITNTWGAQFDKYFDTEPQDPFTGDIFKVGPNEPGNTSEIQYIRGTDGATYTLKFIPYVGATATTVCP